jgi:hypothetical protein
MSWVPGDCVHPRVQLHAGTHVFSSYRWNGLHGPYVPVSNHGQLNVSGVRKASCFWGKEESEYLVYTSVYPACFGKSAIQEANPGAEQDSNSMLLMALSTELCCAALVLNRLPFYHWRHPWLLEASTFVAVRVCLRVTCFFSQEHRGYPWFIFFSAPWETLGPVSSSGKQQRRHHIPF